MRRLAWVWRRIPGIVLVAASAYAPLAAGQTVPCAPEQAPPILATVLAPAKGYEIVPQLQPGDAYYTDRLASTHSLAGLPPEPDVLCARWVKTANNDKSAIAEDFLQIALGDLGGREVRVYVGYDTRALAVPNWLANGFTDTGLEIDITEPDPTQEFALWRSRGTFASGETVVLGGNEAAGASFAGSSSNYVAILALLDAPVALPFGPAAGALETPFEFGIDLGALPSRPGIDVAIEPAEADALAELRLVGCDGGNPQTEFLLATTARLIDPIDPYPGAEFRAGAVCRFRITGAPGASGSYQLSLSARTLRPIGTDASFGSIEFFTPEVLEDCANGLEDCSLRSFDFATEGGNFRWVYDGTDTLGTCVLIEGEDVAPSPFGYEVVDPAGDWDCCTWRFDGVDEVTSSIAQVVIQNQGAPPPPDTDLDQILDPCDNCPLVANGPGLGSCVVGDGTPGAPCETSAECPVGQACSRDQEDSNADGVGDACPEPGPAANALGALLGLAAAAARRRGRRR
jgi:hypothetical protein